MPPNTSLPVLRFDEAETVAADLARVWTSLTGITEIPQAETLTDLVQRVQRKAREVIAGREDSTR